MTEIEEKEPTLRELITKAIDDLATYRHPNVQAVQERLHDILVAGRLGGIIHDKLESLSYRHESLHIRTGYSVRQCEQTGYFEFPEFVVDADDPIRTIKIWSLSKTIAATKRELKTAYETVEELQQTLVLRQKELDALGVGTGG